MYVFYIYIYRSEGQLAYLEAFTANVLGRCDQNVLKNSNDVQFAWKRMGILRTGLYSKASTLRLAKPRHLRLTIGFMQLH